MSKGLDDRQARAADGELEDLTRPLASPLEDAASLVWMLDAKGVLVGANRAARALEREARRPLPLRTPAARQILGDASELRRALAQGQPLEVCVRGPRDECLRAFLEPLRSPAGVPTGALLVVPESARPGSSRSLFARIVGTAARELHGPLASALSFARLARRALDGEGEGPARAYLDRLERHVQRLEYLAGELRDLIEIMSDRVDLRLAPFDLARLVRESVDEAASGTAHVFEISAPPHAVVEGDEERIGRVVRALLSNAVRFSSDGGRVWVRLTLTHEHAVLSLTDSGDGIPEERIEDVFDGPCWDDAAPPGGLGLGLYLSREFVERHGGRIRAARAENGGARVLVMLPRVRDAA